MEYTAILQTMEQYAVQEQVPILQAAARTRLLETLTSRQPRAILEIGTAIGYSTLLMASHLPETRITSLELDPVRHAQAAAYLREARVDNRVTLLCGDAGALLPTLNGPFDFVFIDAAKGQYLDYLVKVTANLADEAVIAADNVLFRDMVLGETKPAKRFKTIVNRLRQYLDYVTTQPEFTTTIYPDGDGLAVSIYRRRK